MKKYLLLFIFFALTLQHKAQTILDADGNTYNVVAIGTQIWMKENLKTTKYKDGINIPLVTDITLWSVLTTPGFCTFKNTINADTINTYGRLYNWYTVNTDKLCPIGWHVPTNAEWTTLENFLIANGFNYDGTVTDNKYAKAIAASSSWISSTNIGAVGNIDYPDKRNATGFTALPSGYRLKVGSPSNVDAFFGIGKSAYWWSSTEHNSTAAYYRTISNADYDVYRDDRDGSNKGIGYSIRCLKDDTGDPINILSNPADFAIYPNPAKGMLYLKNASSSNAFVSIYNLQGKQIVKGRISLNSIDISNLSKGIYLVKIMDSGTIFVDKLIKE